MAAEQTTPGWLQSLRARAKSHAGPGSAYAVDEAAHTFGLDALPSPDDELLVDEGRMSVRLPFADGNSRDGVGDLIEVAGIELSRHRQNPIALYDHGKQVSLPVGLTQDRDTGAYTVDISEPSRKAYAEIFFYQGKGLGSVSKEREYDHALFCHQLFDLMARRLVRGGSIGYTVIAARELPPDHRTGTPKGLHLMAVKMLEVSAVVLPANQDTVGKSFLHDPEKHFKAMSETAREILCLPGVCGKSLSPALVKSLEPWAKGKTTHKIHGDPVDAADKREMEAVRNWQNSGQGAVDVLTDANPTAEKIHADVNSAGYASREAHHRRSQKDMGDGEQRWQEARSNVIDNQPADTDREVRKQGADIEQAYQARKLDEHRRRQGNKSQDDPAAKVRDARENAKREADAHGGAERVPPERMAKIDADISAAKAGARGLKDIRARYRKKALSTGDPVQDADNRRREAAVNARQTSAGAAVPVPPSQRSKISADVRSAAEAQQQARRAAGKAMATEDEQNDPAAPVSDIAWNAARSSTSANNLRRRHESQLGNKIQKPRTPEDQAEQYKRMPEEHEYDDGGGLDVSDVTREEHELRQHEDQVSGRSTPRPTVSKEEVQEVYLDSGFRVRRPQATPASPPSDSKALTALKKKYRAVKSVRRKVRSSRAGSATLAVRHKDVRAARAKAESQGLGFAWLRDLPHGAKVRLTGPDERIDEFAREFGVPHQKSLSGGNRHGGGTKSLDTQGGVMNEHDDRSVADGPTEPYGAAVLRRCHEDKRLLLPDYDEMIRLTENEHVRKILTRMAEDHVRHLDEIESAFGKHYKDLPGLEGMESDEDESAPEVGEDEFDEIAEEDEDEVPDDIEELEEEVGEDLDGDMEEGEDQGHLDAVLGDDDDEDDAKDMGDLDMAGVGADSDNSRFDAMEDEDAVHSMKSLRRRYGKGLKKKCKCGSCSACKKGKGLDQGDYARQAEDEDDTPAEEEEVLEEHEEYGHTDDGDASDETLSGGSGFADHELAGLREAHEFLQAIGGENSSFSEEDRMKAYHFHKLLEGIAGPLEEMEDPGLPDTDALFSGESGLKSVKARGKAGGLVGMSPRKLVGGIGKLASAAGDAAGAAVRAVAGGGRRQTEQDAKRGVTSKVAEKVRRAAGKVRDAADITAIRGADAVAGGVNRATAAASKVPGVRKVVRPTQLNAGDVLTAPPKVAAAVQRARGVAAHAAGSKLPGEDE